MRIHCLALLVVIAGVPVLAAQEASRPGLIGRVWNAVQFWKSAGAAPAVARSGGAVLTMELAPPEVRIGETRRLEVTLRLTNRSRDIIRLQFPTSQRFEVWLRDATGRLLEQWSEDQRFSREPVFVTINPREFIEYRAAIATREMQPGTPYTLEAAILGYENLVIRRTIVPVASQERTGR